MRPQLIRPTMLAMLMMLLSVAVLVFPPSLAQEDPAATEDPSVPVTQEEIIVEESREEVIEVDESLGVVLSARSDLELLVAARLGATRPEAWNGSFDVNDPQLPLLVRLDLELLAGTLLGPDTRPDGWFGAVASAPAFFARDLRHDLELLADEVINPALGRPSGWAGAEPLMRCDRLTQAVVQLFESNGTYTLQADRTSPEFCAQAAQEVSLFIEMGLLTARVSSATGPVIAEGEVVVDVDFAVAFLDRAARQGVGVAPIGTPIRPVARSYATFSNMMLVRGEGFEVFVDYNTTSLSREGFEALPNIDDGSYNPFCSAAWCES